MKRIKPYEYPFTAAEANDAFKRWGCNCGPTALAAMLGLKPDDVREHIPNFDQRRYTNPSMMQAALRSLGVGYREVDDGPERAAIETLRPYIARFPEYGVMRIQWEGPWLSPGVPLPPGISTRIGSAVSMTLPGRGSLTVTAAGWRLRSGLLRS